MTVERVSAERSQCVQRIEQKALQERLEAERRQVTPTSAVTAHPTVSSSICMNNIQNNKTAKSFPGMLKIVLT